MANVSRAFDKSGGKRPSPSPPGRRPRDEQLTRGRGRGYKKNDKTTLSSANALGGAPSSSSTAAFGSAVSSSMRSDDVPGGIKMGGTTQTQGGEEMSHTQTQTEEEEMQPIRREQKWAIILHTAEKTKLGIELGVVQVEDLEEMIIDMISGALEQLKGILASGHEVACMVSWSMITIKVIEMEEHSRAHLKEDLLSGKAASVETPDVGLLGIPGGSCETKYGFIVFERMKDGCGWRSCIHQRCGERWITDESCPLQSDEEMRKLVFEAADLFRWAKRNKPSDPGFFDCQLSAHIDKTVREIISSTEMLNEKHWKMLARRLYLSMNSSPSRRGTSSTPGLSSGPWSRWRCAGSILMSRSSRTPRTSSKKYAPPSSETWLIRSWWDHSREAEPAAASRGTRKEKL
mmetsp:Transcript_15808/g.39111  ORF Transcript_15808/g.39111 Transcript_15808/m.39111 type:complete len:403 (-) Transcript_15808:503-1711(-)